MAGSSPRANLQNSRRSIVDGSVEGTQSGKIPRISETPRAEKANADLNKRAAMENASERDDREIG